MFLFFYISDVMCEFKIVKLLERYVRVTSMNL